MAIQARIPLRIYFDDEARVETWAQAILKWIASDPRVSTVLTATQRLGRAAENARGGEPPMFTAEQRWLVSRICAAD